MSDPREELTGLAREARVLLERERARGRAYVTLAGRAMQPTDTGPRPRDEASRAQVAPLASSPDPFTPHSFTADSTTRAGTIALPGFESLVPSPAGLSVREDLPDDLGTLARLVSECRKCRLCETRTNTVFADGSVKAKLLLIGEAPGRDEDLKGLPFVGRAGQLLDKMIAAIQLRRDEVYICNVLKCRPPENRTPLQDEVDQCMPYLEQQLALVRPALICALGLSAVQALLKTKSSMASLRGRTFEYKGIPLIPTYHPAALLRNPGLKREAWEDLQRVRDTLKAQGAS